MTKVTTAPAWHRKVILTYFYVTTALLLLALAPFVVESTEELVAMELLHASSAHFDHVVVITILTVTAATMAAVTYLLQARKKYAAPIAILASVATTSLAMLTPIADSDLRLTSLADMIPFTVLCLAELYVLYLLLQSIAKQEQRSAQ